MTKITPYIKLLRPNQWLKNLMLLFPPFLGGTIFQDGMIQKGIFPLVAFCLVSSCTYIFNDTIDATKDAIHPKKKDRPIAAGLINNSSSFVIMFVLFVFSLLLSLNVSPTFLYLLLIYLTVAILYSIKLKEFPIIDIFCISAGFLFRLQAGGIVFGIKISDWLFLSVFLLSLFLSTGKRLFEKISLGDNAGNHRKSLLYYPDGYLEGTMYMTGSAVLVTYTMYVIQRPALVYTVPLCTFGLMRYILRVKSGTGGDPTESLLKDMPLLVIGLLWTFMVGWSIYGG